MPDGESYGVVPSLPTPPPALLPPPVPYGSCGPPLMPASGVGVGPTGTTVVLASGVGVGVGVGVGLVVPPRPVTLPVMMSLRAA